MVGALSLRLLRDPLANLRTLGIVVGARAVPAALLGLGNIVFQFPGLGGHRP